MCSFLLRRNKSHNHHKSLSAFVKVSRHIWIVYCCTEKHSAYKYKQYSEDNYNSCLQLRVDLGDMQRGNFCSFVILHQLFSRSSAFTYHVLSCAQDWNVSFVTERNDSHLSKWAASTSCWIRLFITFTTLSYTTTTKKQKQQSTTISNPQSFRSTKL